MSDATVTIRPYPRSIISGITAWQYCSGPRTSVLIQGVEDLRYRRYAEAPETSGIGTAYTTTSTLPHTSFAVVAAHFAAAGSAGSPSSKPPLDALRVQQVRSTLAHDAIPLHKHDTRPLASHPQRHAEPNVLPATYDYHDLPIESPHACPKSEVSLTR